MTPSIQRNSEPPREVVLDAPGQSGDVSPGLLVAEDGRAAECVLVIFNPVSGKGDPDIRKSAITAALAAQGRVCEFITTNPDQTIQTAVKQAVEKGARLVVVSGGDGTVMEVASALVGSNVPIAVIPAGTGNLLCENLGIPGTVPEAVAVALSGHIYPLDLARTDSGRYFAIMGGMGMDAQIIADSTREAKNRLGVLAYFVAALKSLARHRPLVEVRIDNHAPIRCRAKTVIVANMGKITGGINVLPTAVPDDGLLDIGIVRVETLSQWLRLLAYAVIGRAHDDPDFDVFQTRQVAIRTLHAEPIQFDGEDGGRATKLSIEVVPGAIGILLPSNAPAGRGARESRSALAKSAARRRLFGPLLVLSIAAIAWLLRRRR